MMITKNDEWVDRACVVLVRCSDGKEAIVWTDSLAIPQAMAKNRPWSPLKDPHLVLTGGKRSRSDFIADALARALGSI